jgi:hypothetical protein
MTLSNDDSVFIAISSNIFSLMGDLPIGTFRASRDFSAGLLDLMMLDTSSMI